MVSECAFHAARAPGHSAASSLGIPYPLTQDKVAGLPPLSCPELLLSTLQLQDPVLMGRDGVPTGEVPGGGCSECCLLGLVMVGRQAGPSPPPSFPHSIIQSS